MVNKITLLGLRVYQTPYGLYIHSHKTAKKAQETKKAVRTKSGTAPRKT